MKFTLDWLLDHLDTDADVAAITAALNRIGHEVEGVEDPAARLAGFTIARVLTAAPHPQADKLQLLTVDAGDGTPVQVVCGAPNARAGLVGVFGTAGAVVPASGMVLRKAAIRGVESNGMMCSARELELGDDHDGIIDLPADAPIGTAFADYAGLGDPVIDVAITPNRQDCMGVRGIARDLAAAGLGTLKPLIVPDIAGTGPPIIAVRTDDAEGCPAFYARSISGLTNGTAPAWMQRRLAAVGQRSISALVDITNYVMIDLGRPSHVYDAARLSGTLVARRAHEGETLTALNGKAYRLTPAMTVIADDVAVHDIGGIMGGAHSGCSEDTSDVLIEIAWFTPEQIAVTGQTLGLASDARSRFERGVDPTFLDDALAILTGHIIAICGGQPSQVQREGSPPVTPRQIGFDPALTHRLGGMDVAGAEQWRILTALGFGVADGGGGGGMWRATIPSWRRDIHGPADLVEEVTRITGLDALPSAPLPRAEGVARPVASAAQLIERRARRVAAASGFHEAVTWSFISAPQAAAVGGGHWTLANPISEEMKVMRPSLLPGLLAAAARGRNHGAASIRLFEIGRRYLADAERPTLALLMAGDAQGRHWLTGKAQPFGPFDAKAAALTLLDALDVPTDRLLVMAVADGAADGGADIWHPGLSASLRLGPKTVLADCGMLHPALTRAFDLAGPVAAVQLYLDALPARRGGITRPAHRPPALQTVVRDFAFLAPADLSSADLTRAIAGADKALISGVQLFDRFTGAGAPDGQISLAVAVTLQPVDKSLSDADIKAVSDSIVAAAARLGALLRG